MHRKALWDLPLVRMILEWSIGLLTGYYPGTMSSMKCVCGDMFCIFIVDAGVREGCVSGPSHFIASMDWVLGRVVDQSCGASVGISRVTDLVLTNAGVILAAESDDDSRGTTRGGKALGTSSLLGQNQGTGVLRLDKRNYTVCLSMW